MTDVDPNHPRAESLQIREKIAAGFKKGLVTPEGLSAHGRGEAFDYMLGERTTKPAREAITAASAMILASKNPIISVNGNVAALVAKEIAEMADETGINVEVNLFHRSKKRRNKIAKHLLEKGVKKVLGNEEKFFSEIPEIKSHRRVVDERGIKSADTVIVPLEDGDRTEALVDAGKKVITIDLNPLSRTAQAADITIVDNVVRALPELTDRIKKLSKKDEAELEDVLKEFNNKRNLNSMTGKMVKHLKKSTSK
ncbi:MAG: phosphopantothenate/pantothenate synthetase [Candidatus Hadarchaeia archaeon]